MNPKYWSLRLQNRHKFLKFLDYEEVATEAANLLSEYLENTIDNAYQRQYHDWSVTCLPSTRAGGLRRLFCVNMSGMETFVVGYYKDEPKVLSGFVNVSTRILAKHLPQLKTEFPEFGFTEVGYVAAEGDSTAIDLSGNSFWDALTDERIVEAAGALNTRLMQDSNRYARYHNFDLVDYAFGKEIPKDRFVEGGESDNKDAIQVGAMVIVQEEDGNLETYILVDAPNVDPSQGKISTQSPIGNALLGKSVGVEIVVDAPDGKTTLKIIEVRLPE